RYVLRYLVNNWLFSGNYVGPVKEVLAPQAGRQRRALELGTRTGTWIQSMATEFPHVQFHTLDVVPIMAHAPRANITFEVYDFTEGILLEDGSQDVVFLNMVMEMVKDYRGLIREVYRVLRPGGVIHTCDYIPFLWDSQNPAIPAERINPAASRIVSHSLELLAKIGIDPETCNKLPKWLAPESDIWDNNMDERRGFEQIQLVVRTHPAYPHPGSPCSNRLDGRIGPYLGYLTVMLVRDLFGVLKDKGMEEEEVKKLIEDMIDELKRHDKCALLKLSCVYATKI
ncbi:hypothetical protein FRC12_012813, partial [Ceratobasidium sp. 428]